MIYEEEINSWSHKMCQPQNRNDTFLEIATA